MANRLRSALTMLGHPHRRRAVIVLVAVGNGSSAAMQNQLAGLGTNTLTIFPTAGASAAGAATARGTQSRRATLTAKDVTRSPGQDERTGHHRGVAGRQRERDRDLSAAPRTRSRKCVGTTPTYLAAAQPRGREGSSITDDDVTSTARS